MGRLSGLSLWAQYNHHTSCKRDAEVLSIRRECRMMAEAALKLCALEMEQGTTSQGKQAATGR